MYIRKLAVNFLTLLVIALIRRCSTSDNCESLCLPDGGPICALEKESVCFKRFPTECHMKIAICEKPKEYIIYPERYCNLVGFMCSNEYKAYSEYYARHENLDRIIYGIYDVKRT